jgi:hypothetical protein
LSVDIQKESPFPLSKPLIFLFFLTAIYTSGLSSLAFRGVISPLGQSQGLWSIIFGLILTWWVYLDRGTRQFGFPFEFEFFVLFAWPVLIPYYLYRRLGRLGLLYGLGIWGLYVVPYLITAFVYAFVQVYRSR